MLHSLLKLFIWILGPFLRRWTFSRILQGLPEFFLLHGPAWAAQVFACLTTWAAARLPASTCQLPQEFHDPTRVDRTPSTCYLLLSGSTTGFWGYCHGRPLCVPTMEMENMVHQDSMSPASLRALIKDLSDSRFCQTFPADPHSVFGSSQPVQLPPFWIQLTTRRWSEGSSALTSGLGCPDATCTDGHTYAWTWCLLWTDWRAQRSDNRTPLRFWSVF